MDDRELLELAAKAAGLELSWEAGLTPYRTDNANDWNPLEDDGDALRLAVRLAITDLSLAVGRLVFDEGGMTDIYAATRRAIVRAAAAMANTT